MGLFPIERMNVTSHAWNRANERLKSAYRRHSEKDEDLNMWLRRSMSEALEHGRKKSKNRYLWKKIHWVIVLNDDFWHLKTVIKGDRVNDSKNRAYRKAI